MDLALNNLQCLICRKTQVSSQPTNQPTTKYSLKQQNCQHELFFSFYSKEKQHLEKFITLNKLFNQTNLKLTMLAWTISSKLLIGIILKYLMKRIISNMQLQG